MRVAGEDSKRISLKDIARGKYFGELSLFDDKPRSASALATTDAVLLTLQRATLQSCVARRPRAAMAILCTMSERPRETNALLSALVARNVDEEFDKNVTPRRPTSPAPLAREPRAVIRARQPRPLIALATHATTVHGHRSTAAE